MSTPIASVQLIYQPSCNPANLPVVRHSIEAFDEFIKEWDVNTICLQQQVKVMLLNRAHKIIGIVSIAKGGVHAITIDPKLIFAAALTGLASSIIIAHNYTSGNVSPSDEHIDKARQLVEGGKILGIRVIDYLVISQFSYHSFAENGLLASHDV
jgi:DNA repair protein RadC